MRTLFVRLSIVLLGMLLLFGAFSLWFAERGAQAYFLEFTQRLNAPIAMYMVENVDLVRDGQVDTAALAELADRTMVINPSVELYLLDPDGRVIAQAANANSIAAVTVDLEPIQRFLATGQYRSEQYEAILGDNPLDTDERRVFSAHPLVDGDRIIGYVYAVLAGRQYQSLLEAVESSYSVRNFVQVLAGVLALAGVGGFIIFFTLTRRLRKLTRRVKRLQLETFESADVDTTPVIQGALGARAGRPELLLQGPTSEQKKDEIDELTQAYDNMASMLQIQYSELAAKDKARRELLANISHDLRTPLTTLQGYLETVLIKHRILDEDLEYRYLSIAHKHGSRLHSLISQLFDLSKLDSGDVGLNTERFSLLELAHDALQDIEIRATARCVNLSLVNRIIHAGTRHCNVVADISLIHRVLENLLDNALRHTKDNGEVRIVLESAPDDRVSIAVSDTGCGMSPETVKKIFEPGFTSTAVSSDSEQHAGLGLAIVNGIVNLHGSSIAADSTPGQGTTFKFSLPLAV